MKAKEMFEELGWQCVTNEESYIVYKKGFRTISFIKDEHTGGLVAPSCHLDMSLLKAVNQQCKEFGWI